MNKLIFGNIENIKPGKIFNSRKELALSLIHKPLMSGIWGREKEGACSIVLSGGYEDDIDNINYIFYTGQGGQDVPGGNQISDQKLTRGNKALKVSLENSLPVRVTRGFQVKHGPASGYRYDGLYYVKSFERVKGKSGFYIYRFYLVSKNYLKSGKVKNIEKALLKIHSKKNKNLEEIILFKKEASLGRIIEKIYRNFLKLIN